MHVRSRNSDRHRPLSLVTDGANIMNYKEVRAVETSNKSSLPGMPPKETAPAASVFLDTKSLVTNMPFVTATESLKIVETADDRGV